VFLNRSLAEQWFCAGVPVAPVKIELRRRRKWPQFDEEPLASGDWHVTINGREIVPATRALVANTQRRSECPHFLREITVVRSGEAQLCNEMRWHWGATGNKSILALEAARVRRLGNLHRLFNWRSREPAKRSL
jgi:hypothetical protein